MKPLQRIVFFICLFNYLAANSQTENIDNQIQMIKICVDSTISIGGNSPAPYIIDFSKTNFWEKEIIENYFQENNFHKPGILDSIIKYDENWIKYEVLSQNVIQFHNVERINTSTLKVETSHLMSSDGSFGLEIILEEEKGIIKCKSIKITWIS
ncbi:MAG: hypothetical protein Q8K02_03515 [Flavobacterium sp.]|nr:hypothetical protein [Flavobacterium sp.]